MNSAAPKHLGPMVCKSGELVLSMDAPMLATLGSCVGLIVFDTRTGLHGLNHYLLPDPSASSRNSDLGDLEFGSFSIPTLFREMKERGSRKADLRVWMVGGASQFASANEVGRQNVEVAERLLRDLEIPCLEAHVGGELGRRVEVNIATRKISIWLLRGAKSRASPDVIYDLDE